MMKYDMDELLRNALSSKEEPDDRLNQDLIRKVQEKEREDMSKKNRFKVPAVAAMAVLVLSVGSITGYAAWKYLTPHQIAEIAEDQGLAAAFQSEGAVALNEVQEYSNYRITLLGIVSGENLSQYLVEDDAGNVSADRTYVVTAIENADGTPRPDTSDDNYGEDPFFVSPLIQGLNPAVYNIASMNGGYFETVQDGIQYRIAECDNVEKFADRPVYLCVCDGIFYNNEAFQYDEKSGAISRNEHYQGVNALFTLPLDESKTDKKGAEAYLKSLEDEWNSEDISEVEDSTESSELDISAQAAQETMDWKAADFEENTKLVKEMEVAPDTEGNFSYQYQLGEDGISSDSTVGKDTVSERDEGNMAIFRNIISGDSQTAYIETYTIQEDGTMLLRVYEYSK